MIIGMLRVSSSKCHLSSFTSTNSSGTASKNISVERRIPASCIPRPADTLNCEGVKIPISSVKGCSFSSFISCGEKVLLLPAKDPNVLILLLTMI